MSIVYRYDYEAVWTSLNIPRLYHTVSVKWNYKCKKQYTNLGIASFKSCFLLRLFVMMHSVHFFFFSSMLWVLLMVVLVTILSTIICNS